MPESVAATPLSLETEIILPEGDFAAFIFDCDGTLADTMPAHYQAWRAALAEHKAEIPEALFYELGGVPTEKIVELLNERYGHNMPTGDVAHRKEALFYEFSQQIAPIAAVVKIALENSGRLPMAVASGGRGRIVRRTLDALKITSLFQAIVTAEDYEHGKPAPDPFLEAARRLGVDPTQCLVFEDTKIGIQAAESAGMKWVLVPPVNR